MTVMVMLLFVSQILKNKGIIIPFKDLLRVTRGYVTRNVFYD